MKNDNNKVFITGTLLNEINEKTKEFSISNDNGEFTVFIPRKFEFLKEKGVSKGMYSLVYGFLSSTPEANYIFPLNVSFSKVPQSHSNDVFFSGKVLHFYPNEKTNRFLVESIRKDVSTRLYVVAFKEDFSLSADIVSSRVFVYGYLKPIKTDNKKFEIIARDLMVFKKENNSVATSNLSKDDVIVVSSGNIEDEDFVF